MLVPLSWLAELVEVRGTAQAVCDALTGAGVETEVAEDARPDWSGVVTAKLLHVGPHPGADRLTVTRPTDGTTEWDVVCGATNHKTGDVIALATVGTKLPNGVKIKKSKIRGEPSEGMLCSEAELGLSEEAAGIIILPPDTPLGVPLADVLPAGDVILEASPEANRGDCLSVLGLARELSAVTGWPLRGRGATEEDTASIGLDTLAMASPVSGLKAGMTGEGDRRVRVEIDALDGCPRYAGAVMSGVQVGPSPRWITARLEAAGVRPINNVVDCTNYVMLELGNPLHAFDRRFVRGGVVSIRWAGEGEQTTTLDGKLHKLHADDLVIADGEGVIALAGVMGGENSEVRDDTTTLFLESAHFDPAAVRRTAHRTRIGSEASYRFARGVDPELPGAALNRLIELLERTTGGRLQGTPTDVYPRPSMRPTVTFRLSRIGGLLGMTIPEPRVRQLLARAGLAVVDEGRGSLTIQPPSYRFDVEREVDVLEEIARLEGYDSIPEVLPERALQSVPRRAAGLDVGAVRRSLMSCGLSEAVHFSFIDPGWVEALGVAKDHQWRARAVRVNNPLSEVGGVLRPTLLPSLLRATARNLAMGAGAVRLFELRTTFLARPEGYAEIIAGRDGRPLNKPPVIERATVCGVLVGPRRPAGWASPDDAVDLYDVRACVDAATAALGGLRGWSWGAGAELPWLSAAESAVLVHASGKREPAGWFGRIAVPVLREYEVDQVAWAFEIDLTAVGSAKPVVPRFEAFSRFPMVERDLAFVVPDGVPAATLLDQAERTARKGMKDSFCGVEVFDVYRGAGIPAGTRSVALRFRFRAPDRTLQDRAVDGVMTQIQRRLSQTDGVELRA